MHGFQHDLHCALQISQVLSILGFCDALGGAPPAAELHKVYSPEEAGVVLKGAALQPTREEPMAHDQAEQPRAWDPADILRGLQTLF